jgi:hypothetical protein
MCGNVFSSPKVQVSNAVCNYTCPGNVSQTCGGFIGPTYYVSVYSTENCKLKHMNSYLRHEKII